MRNPSNGIEQQFCELPLDYVQIPHPLKTPNDALYIHERLGQIAILERGAASVRRANRELKKYQKNLRQGLVQELVYLRRTGTD